MDVNLQGPSHFLPDRILAARHVVREERLDLVALHERSVLELVVLANNQIARAPIVA